MNNNVLHSMHFLLSFNKKKDKNYFSARNISTFSKMFFNVNCLVWNFFVGGKCVYKKYRIKTETKIRSKTIEFARITLIISLRFLRHVKNRKLNYCNHARIFQLLYGTMILNLFSFSQVQTKKLQNSTLRNNKIVDLMATVAVILFTFCNRLGCCCCCAHIICLSNEVEWMAEEVERESE